MRLLTALLIFAWMFPGQTAPAQERPATERKRIILISSPGADPAEAQSFVRFLLYSNEFDVEGLIAASSWWVRPGWPGARSAVHPEMFTERIQAYGKVQGNLLKHAAGYPSSDFLLGKVAASTNSYGMEGVGDNQSTPASKLITAVVEKADPRPVYVVVTGGSNPLAQTLWDYRKSHSREQMEAFVAKLRVFESTGLDDAGAWMCHEFPSLFFVRSATQAQCLMGPDGPEGMEPFDGPRLWGRSQFDWAEANLRIDHGALGALYPQRILNGRIRFLEGAGTAPWLGLISNGLGDASQPSWGGWGGRFSPDKRFDITASWPRVWETEHKWRHWAMYEEVADAWQDGTTTVYSGTCVPLWRWRAAYQNDFQGRMDWSVKEYKDANHNPVAAFRGEAGRGVVRLTAQPGESVLLDASASKDPDNDGLDFRWSVYPEITTYPGTIRINREKESIADLTIPADASGKQIHIVLEVRDRNSVVPMSSYRRIVINVS